MNRYFFIVLVFFLGASSVYASCTQYSNKLTGLLGLGAGGTLIFADVSSNSNACSCAEVRFKPENTDINIALSILLAARLSGKEVRIDLKDAEDCDSANNVYIQN